MTVQGGSSRSGASKDSDAITTSLNPKPLDFEPKPYRGLGVLGLESIATPE